LTAVKKRWQALVLGGIAVLVALGPLVWLIGEARALFVTSTDNAEKASALQAVAAIGGLAATILLIMVTGWYAVLTRDILRQSGPIVETDLRMAFMAHGSAITGPMSMMKQGTPDQRYDVPAFAIEVRNRGNAGVLVTRVAVETEAGFSIIMTQSVAGRTPPLKLEGHSSETVYLDHDMVMAGVSVWEQVMKTPSRKLRAVVSLGSGVVVNSGWEMLP